MEKTSTSAFQPKQSPVLNSKYADLFGNNAKKGVDHSTVNNSNINKTDIGNNDNISTSSRKASTRNKVTFEKQPQADVDCYLKILDKTENSTGMVNYYDDNKKDNNNEMLSFSIRLPGFRHFNKETTWLNVLSVSFTNMTGVVGAAMMVKLSMIPANSK
ncbi:hypothetical protein BDK51DRAFT_34859 [Blyttiomyces helicus]|uniref:Uncharacterized protein n=1 Tax=Blyttiomyces helicus TaxID=388810 RepID=A0A4P9WPE4_9FUNG|nr:hypothetical protein BDK51DRAFT_34859 [Blyttiomyces helicus]|eukprot:RKO94372.1 hypothetical protein BDK51DRAFT_34859 [Blyttiomyces helicus]